jgi:hypothetical protein
MAAPPMGDGRGPIRIGGLRATKAKLIPSTAACYRL